MSRGFQRVQRFEYDAPRWVDFNNMGEDTGVDAWFDLPHPLLEMSQTAYQLLIGESIGPGEELDEQTLLALDKDWEEALNAQRAPAPPSTPPPRSPAPALMMHPSPSPSPSKVRRRLFSPTKPLGPPRRVLVSISNTAEQPQQQKPAVAPPTRKPAAIRFTAAPTK